jgi:hypothetical protein
MKHIPILLAFASVCGIAAAVPTPIPPPKQTYAEACELVLKEQVKDGGKEALKKSPNAALPQIVTYTSFQYSVDLQGYVEDEELTKEKLKEKGKDWILTEWGWLITIVVGLDLSQSDTYFVRPSGEVVLLWSTN